MQNVLSQHVRVRIAPSPTGKLHIGTALAALFNYLFAKRNNGRFILRLEDTDKDRSKSEFDEEIVLYLRWLGMSWDEGALPGGKNTGADGPYRSSERMNLYRPYIEKLLEKGRAFYCFMTEAHLDDLRKKADADGTAFLMRSPWRDAPLAEARKKVAYGEEHVIRFKVPSGRGAVAFDDCIRGRTEISVDVIEDFAIAKDADTALYNFAVAVDDHLMRISHVIRGEDHISNTPKQLLLYEALDWHPPEFAHLPLILGPDRSKLSKRHGATSIAEFAAQGYLPEALVNFMALLGWNPGDARELFSLRDLEKEFGLERVQKSGAVFNQEKLDWVNAQHIKRLSDDELAERLMEHLRQYSGNEKKRDAIHDEFAAHTPAKRTSIARLVKDRLQKLSEFPQYTEFLFAEPVYGADLLRWKTMSDEEIAQSLTVTKKLLGDIPSERFNAEWLNAELNEYAVALAERGIVDKGTVFWPLRVALTGRKTSPPPVPIMEILGKEKTLQRIAAAVSIVKKT